MKYIKEVDKHNSDLLGIALGCVYLFFTFLGSSIFLPALVTRVTMLVFLIYGAITFLGRLSAGTLRLNMYSVWYGIFVCYTIVSFSFSSYPSEIRSNHFYQMIVCLIITLFLAEFVGSEKDFCWICWAYILSSIVMIVLLYRSGKLVGDYNERLGNEVSGNANVFATFVMYSVLYALWLLVFQNYGSGIKILLCLSILFGLYAIMLSAGRKFFVIPFIFIYIILLLKNETMQVKNIIVSTMIMILIAVIVYNVIARIPALYNSIGVRMEQLINSVTGGGKVDNSSIVRSQMRSVAIQGWIKKPLFGNGFNTFIYLRSPDLLDGGSHGYSHCNFTELLYNGGIIYTILYYSLFGYMLWTSFMQKERERKFRAFTLAALISQIALDYGGVFYDVVTVQVFIMLAVRATELSTQRNKIICRL